MIVKGAVAIGGLTAQGQSLGCFAISFAIDPHSYQSDSATIDIRNLLAAFSLACFHVVFQLRIRHKAFMRFSLSNSCDRRAKARGRRMRIAHPNTEPWYLHYRF